MAIYGYIRKKDSDTATQLREILKYECEEIFIEEGSLTIDSELIKVLEVMVQNDTLVVISLASFGKSHNELNEIFSELAQKNIRLISQRETLDSSSPCSFYELASLVFNVNKESQSIYIKERIAESKKQGKLFGRPSLNEEIIEKIKIMYHSHKLSMRTIASECGVSVGSVHKYIQ